MQQVSDLLAVPAKADVCERLSEVMMGHPERENPLIDPPELAGARQHAATVNDRFQSIGFCELLYEILGSKLCRAVKRSRQACIKILGNAGPADSLQDLSFLYGKSSGRVFERDGTQRRNGVDPRGRQEKKFLGVAPGKIQTVECAEKVGVYDVIRRIVRAGVNAGLA